MRERRERGDEAGPPRRSALGAAGGLLSMEGHWNMGDNPLGLELTEAAEGGSRCLIAEVDTRVGGSEKSAHGWSSRRLQCDW